jgi:hypothetical protein
MVLWDELVCGLFQSWGLIPVIYWPALSEVAGNRRLKLQMGPAYQKDQQVLCLKMFRAGSLFLIRASAKGKRNDK